MVRPPEAEPVSADRTLVATASDTRGPHSMPSTQPRTSAKAGRAATTAPKPTRLATLKAGRTAALAPASMLCRRLGRRRPVKSNSATIAAVRAAATDHTPPTAESGGAPRRAAATEPVSSPGSTPTGMKTLARATTPHGSDAHAHTGAI